MTSWCALWRCGGSPPDHVLAKAQHTKKYFERVEELSMVSGTPISTPQIQGGCS